LARYARTPWNIKSLRFDSGIAYSISTIEVLKKKFRRIALERKMKYRIVVAPAPVYFLRKGAIAEVILYERVK